MRATPCCSGYCRGSTSIPGRPLNRPLKLPLSIKKAAQRLAKEDGVSLNQWIAVAVAEKVGVVETAADFFKKRACKATGEGLIRFLRTAPKAAPDAEDAL